MFWHSYLYGINHTGVKKTEMCAMIWKPQRECWFIIQCDAVYLYTRVCRRRWEWLHVCHLNWICSHVVRCLLNKLTASTECDMHGTQYWLDESWKWIINPIHSQSQWFSFANCVCWTAVVLATTSDDDKRRKTKNRKNTNMTYRTQSIPVKMRREWGITTENKRNTKYVSNAIYENWL